MSYDLIVVGSGPGGYVAAIRASQLGLKVGVVERTELGGICLNWGCIPTKALLKSAQVFEYIQHASDYGITVGNSKAEIGEMVKRSRGVADGMSKGIQFLFKKNKIDHIDGFGKLKNGTTVEVTSADGKKTDVTAKNVILALGARSRELPNLKKDGKKIIGYRAAMVMDKQPKKMVVVGSGAIGVEFAYFYNAIGTEVTIVEYLPRIVPVEDEEVSKALVRSFKKSGIKIKTDSSVESVDTSGDGCKVTVKTKKGEEVIECDVVLSAVGIQANIEDCGLEDTGVIIDAGKIKVDEFYATNIPNVFAIGDCIAGPALAHVASAEGIIALRRLLAKTQSRWITETFLDVRTVLQKWRLLVTQKQKQLKLAMKLRLENSHSRLLVKQVPLAQRMVL
jgi:dihydrolipoamide dehydrogenase